MYTFDKIKELLPKLEKPEQHELLHEVLLPKLDKEELSRLLHGVASLI